MKATSVLREPLVHFLAGGALLFLLYGFVNRDNLGTPDEIVIDDATVTAIVSGFTRTWQRPPSRTELRGLVDNWVREEILYREGLTMGLDENDPVIRRRVAQKIEFIAEGMIDVRPEEADLQTWLDEHPDNYRVPAIYTLRQAFFDPDRHGDRLDAVLAEALAELRSGEIILAGDPTLLPERLDVIAEDVLGRVIGVDFAAALKGLPVGEWTGPVESDFGLHLVYIESVEHGRLPALEEIRRDVERDVLRVMTEESNTAFYEALREKYTVNITADLPVPDGAE